MSIPADLVARLSTIFARMGARGLLEPVEVYSKQVVLSGGVPVARQRNLLGTIQAYYVIGGGSEVVAQEGMRAAETKIIYFPLDTSGLLNDSTYTERWVILPNRGGAFLRIAVCQSFGPYTWAMLDAGGTADNAGGIK